MDHVLERVDRAGTKFALMHIDLDSFKVVNDSLGHAAGDHVLQVTPGAMVDETCSDDTMTRVGWDEFVILFQELTDKRTLGSIARRLIARIEEPVMFNGQACAISASVGIALWAPGQGSAAGEAMDQADVALYAAKNAGKAQHVFFRSRAAGRPGCNQYGGRMRLSRPRRVCRRRPGYRRSGPV